MVEPVTAGSVVARLMPFNWNWVATLVAAVANVALLTPPPRLLLLLNAAEVSGVTMPVVEPPCAAMTTCIGSLNVLVVPVASSV
ncbi:hypothetical protein EEB15_26615 [Ramlibacter sp. WS9]|nr:hypothetical protein EEB15_26615 [Ramlibacter sp. WS9]